ncbi:CAP domain-containing protein [Umbelopsis sp. AD052]|nr:CAP domain-containing protein [Umbelopsis sp. AD052]
MLPITAFVLSVFALVPSLAATTVSQADQAAILSNHNLFRSRIGAPFLVWNTTVADFAENWVNQCINGHSNSPIYGENMGYGYNTWNEMVDAWIEEVRLYNPNTEDLQLDSLHYTQAVWKSTVSIGCAVANCDFNPRYYSCNYYPHGNTLTQFRANVSPN